jgi:hypothetical protein
MFASIRKAVAVTVATATLIGATSIAAQAGQSFTILNDTGVDIHEAYITPTTVDNWGQDMLDGGVHHDGNVADVEIAGYGDACVFDMLFVGEGGEEMEYYDVDVCAYPDLAIQ